MRVRQEKQLNPVSDEVLALTAIVRPILTGTLYALKRELVKEIGNYDDISLKMLARLYKPGDGDCGICFEYAVHDALNRHDQRVVERVSDAIKLCRLGGTESRSILFGAEKSGVLQLIDTAREILTDESSLLYGTAGRPAKLLRHLESIVKRFRRPSSRLALPYSISGLWKADLFIGCTDTDKWVGTTVKNDIAALQGAKGLRIGIVPSKQGRNDKVRKDESKNLVICPLAHDGDFMQTFYEGWQIVQAFIAAQAKLPTEAMLPRPPHRHVARILADRRDFPVVEVVDAIRPFAQPELLETADKEVDLLTLMGDSIKTDMFIAPISRKTD
jgi:hypothetical protein